LGALFDFEKKRIKRGEKTALKESEEQQQQQQLKRNDKNPYPIFVS